MGLYINENHYNIYKNNNELMEPNQGYFIKNHVAEMVEEQRQINQSLHQSINKLNHLYRIQEEKHLNRWDQVEKQYNEMNQHQIDVENRFLTKLKQLDESHNRLLRLVEQDQLSKQKSQVEIKNFRKTQDEMLEVLNTYSLFHGEVTRKLDEQILAHKHMEQKLDSHEKEQKQVIHRIENQEALSEKIIRQLEHFRSILFERSSYLSEKLEKLSSYVYKSLTSSEDLERRIMVVTKKEKSNK